MQARQDNTVDHCLDWIEGSTRGAAMAGVVVGGVIGAIPGATIDALGGVKQGCFVKITGITSAAAGGVGLGTAGCVIGLLTSPCSFFCPSVATQCREFNNRYRLEKVANQKDTQQEPLLGPPRQIMS